MNLFQKIKLALAGKSLIEDAIKEARIMDGVKPGWKTTEFWGKIAVQVMSIWGMAKGFVPPQYAIIGTVGLEALYNIGRIVVKAVADANAAK